ncbi:MAG: PqiC family protein [Thermodesulfobacteriota bacterium]
MRHILKQMHAVLLLCTGLLLLPTGCFRSPSTARLYALSPIEHSREITKVSSGVTVLLGPVVIPSIIDRPQLVVRSKENRIQIFEESRWAGSFKEDIIRVLAENLNILMYKEGISVFTDEFIINPAFHLAVTINRFDGSADDRVRLNAAWMIRDSNSKAAPSVNLSSIEEPVRESGIEALVAAESRALSSLSREIARELILLRDKFGK